MASASSFRPSTILTALAVSALASLVPAKAFAEATILIEADSGKVLHAENATYPWYPASVTKLMTAYVTLEAVKNRRLTLDTLLTVSARANAQQPSKMGFKPGTKVTVDNALKMLMVKSANDIAVVLAEGVSGSVEQFADDMNQTAKRLGMTQSNYVNPNGLPAERQITSARDMAILGRALIHDFPDYDFYWDISGIKFGKRVMRNYNSLIGRYPGADGMKTGFICASGFNLVASATRNGKRLIAVVLGAPSSPVRAAKAASLLERGFQGNILSWLTPSLGNVKDMAAIDAAPPDLREEMCGRHRKRPAAEQADDEEPVVSGIDGAIKTFMLSSLPPGSAKPSSLLGPVPAITNPVVVFAGAGKRSAESQVAAARARHKHGGNVQTASAAVGPAPDRFAPTTGTTTGNRAMSFAPSAKADNAPPPLTEVPGALQVVAVPMPKPRPKRPARKR